jgi:CubicO group peptidase (beta-lactamase class C family)
VVTDGSLKWAKGYGIADTESGQEVGTGTLFQAGSISKPVAALAILKLMEEGSIDLDTDINTYLTDWKIPQNGFTVNEKVTARRLLTHTAGMTVHGFPGYLQTDTFPSIQAVLNGAGNTPPIFVDTIPGSIWRYSGGGYAVLEKMVEEVSGLSFETYMEENILKPMGMVNSTYEQPLPEKYHSAASAAYDGNGAIIEGKWHNYPEHAAAGLWTTPSDLALYCMEIQAILSGEKTGILSKETVEEMISEHKGNWGLGPSLTGQGDSFCFQHGGKNAGFTNFMIAYARQGNAAIVMTNADNGGNLIREVMRGISLYYGWEIASQRIIEPVELWASELARLTGRYYHNTEQDYIVEIKLKNGHLHVINPNEQDSSELTALDKNKFLLLENGDEVVFQNADGGKPAGFLWNNRVQFFKTED